MFLEFYHVFRLHVKILGGVLQIWEIEFENKFNWKNSGLLGGDEAVVDCWCPVSLVGWQTWEFVNERIPRKIGWSWVFWTRTLVCLVGVFFNGFCHSKSPWKTTIWGILFDFFQPPQANLRTIILFKPLKLEIEKCFFNDQKFPVAFCGRYPTWVKIQKNTQLLDPAAGWEAPRPSNWREWPMTSYRHVGWWRFVGCRWVV